ncbi:MAG: AMP-binding protein [Pseudomonadota bacterium]
MADTLITALAAQADASPDASWLTDGQMAWSASRVMTESRALAGRLKDSRVVAVLADNSPAWVVADLAAQMAGKPHLPLPAFFSAGQLAHVLDQSGADMVLTDQPERIGALEAGFAITGTWQHLTMLRRVCDGSMLPADTGKISFTSGSTGTPKGVCLSLAGLLATARALDERLGDLPIRRHLAVLPLSLLLENVAGVYAPLLRGATVHLPPLQQLGWQGMAGFNPRLLQAAVAGTAPHSLILVPELLKAWSTLLSLSGQGAPEGLSYVAVGGARVDSGLLAQARSLGIPAYQGYGLTECGSVVSLNRPGDDGDGVGRPLGHAAIQVHDGEVQITTRAFLGYLGNQAEGPPPAGSPLATGDLGSLNDQGHLHLQGRRKHLIINAFGRNISPEWVESALLAQPAIAQALVAGEAQPHLAALLVPAPGTGDAALAAAVEQANAGLPDYARVARWQQVAPFRPENGQATGNGRPVRQAIHAAHAQLLQQLFTETEPLHALL